MRTGRPLVAGAACGFQAHETVACAHTGISMKSLLVINSNTSTSVGEIMRSHLSAALPDVAVEVILPSFGAPYIASEATYAVAGHAVLDAWARWRTTHDADPDGVLIGCFGDPGLHALRESTSTHVTGLAEASFVTAARHGRFAVVTGGTRWKPILERLAQGLGFGDRLAGVHALAPTGGQMASDRAGALAMLRAACIEAAQVSHADAVILGGAGLAGIAAEIQPDVPVPLIDNVLAGAGYVFDAPMGSGLVSADEGWQNVSPELAGLARHVVAKP